MTLKRKKKNLNIHLMNFCSEKQKEMSKRKIFNRVKKRKINIKKKKKFYNLKTQFHLDIHLEVMKILKNKKYQN